ncbi:hypothetical protein PVK06_040576 [Gossypium arboreum]|uniref:Uncharacterized protein n=1 Tax=Gossypium arboreum TaxID=29729 RepID=A0ABR0N6M3_GOSAR|nr:hypothetical protein PVK06_040576 [Gossypium arboreum]
MGSHARVAHMPKLALLVWITRPGTIFDMPVWAHMPKLALPVWITLLGPIFDTPVCLTCVGPHTHVAHMAQLGLARVAHLATLEPLHGCILCTAWPLSITRPCVAHGLPHG